MEQFSLEIPLSFIEERVPILWSDVEFGIKNELIEPSEVVYLAAVRLAEHLEDVQLLDLASVDPGDPILELVEALSRKEAAIDEEKTRSKWTYLVLAWLYENREQEPDPLGLVEKVYADFDYPGEVAPFVRYMPADGPDLGSRELNEAKLVERWRDYLENARARFASPLT